MKIIIVSGLETEADMYEIYESEAGYALTEKSKSQTKLIGDYLNHHYAFEQVYASPAISIKQMTEIMNFENVLFEDDLKDFNLGLLAGMSMDIAKQKYPKTKALPMHASEYKQESMLEFRFRAERMLSKIIANNELSSTILIMTHNNMIRELYKAFTRMPVDMTNQNFGCSHGSIHEWMVYDESRNILKMNLQVN